MRCAVKFLAIGYGTGEIIKAWQLLRICTSVKEVRMVSPQVGKTHHFMLRLFALTNNLVPVGSPRPKDQPHGADFINNIKVYAVKCGAILFKFKAPQRNINKHH